MFNFLIATSGLNSVYKKHLILMLLNLTLIVFVYHSVYRQNRKEYRILCQAYRSLQTKVVQLKKHPVYTLNQKKLKADIDYFSRQPQLDANTLVKKLILFVSGSALFLEQIDKEIQNETICLRLRMKGKYSNILLFIKKISNSCLPVKIESIVVQKNAGILAVQFHLLYSGDSK